MKTPKCTCLEYVETEVLHVSTNMLWFIFFRIREFGVLDIFKYVFEKCALRVIHICTQMVVLVYLYIHLEQCSYSTIDFVSSHINNHINCLSFEFCLFDPHNTSLCPFYSFAVSAVFQLVCVW